MKLLHAIQTFWCRGFRNLMMEGDCHGLNDLLHNRMKNANLDLLIIDILNWAD